MPYYWTHFHAYDLGLGDASLSTERVDDAFITYRYADNLRNGLGLVYEPGKWVLGTTSPFYAALLGVLSRFGATVEWWGIRSRSWGIVSAWAALGQLWQRQRFVAGAIAAFLIAILPLIVPTLGMETAFLLALLLLTSWAWMKRSPHSCACSFSYSHTHTTGCGAFRLLAVYCAICE